MQCFWGVLLIRAISIIISCFTDGDIQDIAINSVHDIVYWTDSITSTLYVGSLVTNQYGILINNKSFVNKPSGIVVDPKNEGGYVCQQLVILYQRFILNET